MSLSARHINLEPCVEPLRLPHPADYSPIATAVSYGGEAIRLFVHNDLLAPVFATDTVSGFTTFPVPRTSGEYSGILFISDSWGSEELAVNKLTATYPIIELLPSRELLVVAPRCRRYSDETYDKNARVYAASGEPVRDFLLGDGIEEIQVDKLGQIWVSYFDEGVFGNFGWKTPIGSAGLCCFDASGQRIWEYQPPSGFDHICDCYAMNVSRDGAWVYYYTEFPIVRIDADWRSEGWKSPSSGARALAVRQNRVLLYGGYSERRTACQLLQLGAEQAEVLASVSLTLPYGVDLSKAVVIGRDTDLHVFADDQWYRFSLESLV